MRLSFYMRRIIFCHFMIIEDFVLYAQELIGFIFAESFQVGETNTTADVL